MLKLVTLSWPALLLILSGLSATTHAAEQQPTLVFCLNGDELKQYSIAQLREQVMAEKIEIFDPEYQQVKRYHALPFLPVLQKIYGARLNGSQWDTLSFIAVDGYEAAVDFDKFDDGGGAYLVFADLDMPEWQEIPKHPGTKPGPFYLVWHDKDKTTRQGYHYPWQIHKIALVSRADNYAAIKPNAGIGKEANNSVTAGYELFKLRCQSCHAISGQGGKLGPDLNGPQNILSYRSENMVRAFIKASSQFRHSKMPDFPDLSEQQIDQLIDYLWQLKRQPKTR